MKTSKKILILVTSLAVALIIACGIAAGLYFAFGLHFWGMVALLFFGQIGGSAWYSRYVESKAVMNALKEYTDKPYKQYSVPFTCAACSQPNTIDMDLTNTEFVCSNCNRKNAIYVTFQTAIMS